MSARRTLAVLGLASLGLTGCMPAWTEGTVTEVEAELVDVEHGHVELDDVEVSVVVPDGGERSIIDLDAECIAGLDLTLGDVVTRDRLLGCGGDE